VTDFRHLDEISPDMAKTKTAAHPEAVALYRAICAEPDDDTPRLVYADWLEENGDEVRAEFIRLQCRLARMNEWDDGYTETRLLAERLERDRGKEWADYPPEARRYYGWQRFTRGFVGFADVDTHCTPEDARRLYARFPITAADFTFLDQFDTAQQVARFEFDAYPHLRTIYLDVDHGYGPAAEQLRGRACRALARAECRSELTRLEIQGNPPLDGLEALVTSPHLRRLEALSVRGDGVGDDHARLLAAKTDLPALRELVLGHRALTPRGAEALGRATWFNQLETVRLYGHEQLGDEGAVKLLGSQPLPRLRTVHLHHCGQNGAELRLAGGPGLTGLVEVIVAGYYPEPVDVIALVSGPQQFRSLTIPGARLSATEAARFFNGPGVRELRRLVLPSMNLDTGAVEALAASPLPRSLRSLTLGCELNRYDPVLPLLSPEWPHLERLELPAPVPASTLMAIVDSPKFPRLVSLTAGCRERGHVFLKWLAGAPAAAKMRELELNFALTPATARELADSPHIDGIDRLAIKKGRTDRASCERLVARFGKRAQIAGFNASSAGFLMGE
jgi:uncharacterized protein (TIGR02996 family)